MAFDMYSGEQCESIRDQDEYLFALAEKGKSAYPVLLKLWANFYSDYVLTPRVAAEVVNELLGLYDRHESGASKSIAVQVMRLAKFISFVSVSNLSVRCR